MNINLDTIKTRLFSHPTIPGRVLRDYGVTGLPKDADEFANAIVGQFDQAPAADPLEQTLSNSQVFKAAAKALASNQRSWATFLKFEKRLAVLLHDYDPAQTHLALSQGRLNIDQLKSCLPGTTMSADAKAIAAWAALLNECPDWYTALKAAGHEVRRIAAQQLGKPLPDSRLVLCLVGLLAGPPLTRRAPSTLALYRQQLLMSRPKLPGMGYVLGSEFFRNLHWNAFKPDTHIQRLFNRWFPDAVSQAQPEAERLQALLGRKTKDLSTYLMYSLIGISATPYGVTHSFADNLVWLLGAYVEKSGKESDTTYVIAP